MTSVETSDLCRISVIGPNGKVDLAVPAETTVGALLPVFLQHTAQAHTRENNNRGPDGEHEEGSWVLQRLGEAPFDVDGTPETLDWLEGEELYLRRADNPLPELDFDDLADGIANSVERQPDRWQPEFRRPLFLVLSCVATVVVGSIVLSDGGTAVRMGSAGLLSVLLLVGAVMASRRLADNTLAVLAGLASCGFAGIGGLGWADGVPGTVEINTVGILGASASLLVTSGVLIGLQLFVAKTLSVAPFLAVAMVSTSTIMGFWFWMGLGLGPAQAAGVAATLVLGVIIFAPKMVIKAAHLRGPQLPKTASEMQFDIEPVKAEDVRAKTATADNYLSVVMVAAALTMSVAFTFLMAEPGWEGWALVTSLASAVLLRSRTFLGLWQRGAMAFAGSAGVIMLAAQLWSAASPGWQIVVLLGLILVFGALVLAALRPPPRRLLPIWGHTANVLDTITALATIPILLQLLGVYAWARGLFG